MINIKLKSILSTFILSVIYSYILNSKRSNEDPYFDEKKISPLGKIKHFGMNQNETISVLSELDDQIQIFTYQDDEDNFNQIYNIPMFNDYKDCSEMKYAFIEDVNKTDATYFAYGCNYMNNNTAIVDIHFCENEENVKFFEGKFLLDI